MSEPKSQHVIPRCYLKQFVDPNTPPGQEPYVWIFERTSKRGKKRAPKNILTETDLYTFAVKDGKKDYALERNLSQIESEYASVFENKISRRVPLNEYEHVILCAFVAAMLQRTLKQKENIEGFFDRLITMTEDLERAHGLPPKKSLELRQTKDDAHKITIIQSVPYITTILSKMNLAFLCANRLGSFITSDAPCFLFNSQLQWQRFYGPGLGQKHVEVVMPLSPEICVLFSWANNMRGYLGIGDDLVHEVNRMVVGYTHQYFIANSPKLKRRWFRRFPLDPVLIWRIIRNETRMKLARWRHKRYVRSR
jgi:hypothetical protein